MFHVVGEYSIATNFYPTGPSYFHDFSVNVELFVNCSPRSDGSHKCVFAFFQTLVERSS